jgi:hypothetical protein
MDMLSVLKTTFPVPTAAPDWEIDLLCRLGAGETAFMARNSCEGDFRFGLLLPERVGRTINP